MTRNNIKIAVTGGICSGKSTVIKIIAEQGFPVISCDEIYGELLTDASFVNLIDREFGNIKNNDGTLNKCKLSEIVFSDRDKLEKLNSLTHPEIIQRAMEQMIGSGIYFCEVPLLFEGGFEQLFDNAIIVLRDENKRAEQLMQRNGLNENQAFLRINNQFHYDNAEFIKYYVIHNNKNLKELRKSTLKLLDKIKKDYN